jgi:hypothetical protein
LKRSRSAIGEATSKTNYPRPRKRFGQHFLESAWVGKLVEAVNPSPDDTFVEIGPGRGALTRALARSDKRPTRRQEPTTRRSRATSNCASRRSRSALSPRRIGRGLSLEAWIDVRPGTGSHVDWQQAVEVIVVSWSRPGGGVRRRARVALASTMARDCDQERITLDRRSVTAVTATTVVASP